MVLTSKKTSNRVISIFQLLDNMYIFFLKSQDTAV